MHEMIKLRAKLEELNIGWIDSSDYLFIRTHFWYNNNFVSVVIVEIHFNYPVSIIEYGDIKFNTYTFKGTKLDMLVSDDFEIVYNNEFTYSEYWELMNISAEKGIMWLEEKAIKKINYIEKNINYIEKKI